MDNAQWHYSRAAESIVQLQMSTFWSISPLLFPPPQLAGHLISYVRSRGGISSNTGMFNPLTTEKSKSTFLSNAPWFPEEQRFLDVPRILPFVLLVWKMCSSRYYGVLVEWHKQGKIEIGLFGEKPVPVTLFQNFMTGSYTGLHLTVQFVPRSKHTPSGFQNQSVNAVNENNRCSETHRDKKLNPS